jgi:toxin ParE1/3/4
VARIIWSEPALQDWGQIADYIALDDPVAAVKLVRKVFEKVELFKQFPELFPVAQDLPSARYRHLVVGPLRIFH